MKRNMVIGIFIGIAISAGCYYGYRHYCRNAVNPELGVFIIAKSVVESALDNTKYLDATMTPDSKTKVNFVYDKLYDAHVRYEKNGKIKRITFSLGYYNNTWITPQNTEIVILDDKATIIHVKQNKE